MNLNLMKTVKTIEELLKNDNEINLLNLKKAYEQTLRLRSQLISVIYDIEQYIEPRKQREAQKPEQVSSNTKEIVTLTINEPLPAQKELTAAVEEHWITMIHSAIAEESKTGIPKFEKAMVVIDVTATRGTNNKLVWDVSNRAINVVINNLKGIFFKDDDFEHMAFLITADWGDVGKTVIKICDFDKYFAPI